MFSFKTFITAVLLSAIVFVIGLSLLSFMPAVPKGGTTQQIAVYPSETIAELAGRLQEANIIRSSRAFVLVAKLKKIGEIKPGAYEVSPSMSLLEVLDIFAGEPSMKWVFVPEGLRKEEIAERATEVLGWDEREVSRFLQGYELVENTLREGMYYPDTYLIPSGEGGAEMAMRMINRFREEFNSYAGEFLEENIRWDTALKLASVVQREAAGKSDMPLVAGILWNRLVVEQRLEVDATLQYARGKKDGSWWAPIGPEDKSIDSPYNTYRYAGLPPSPISNPGLDAIKAVLYPEETDCFFYIHKDGQIYCSVTYDEHLEKIEEHLR